MAESTLTLNRDALRNAISFELGYGRTAPDDLTDPSVEIDDVLKVGLRQAYWPPPLPGRGTAHAWRFLRPTATIIVWPTTSGVADTLVEADGETTITTEAATFYPTMVGRSAVFDEGGTYTITAVTSTTEAVVEGDASGEAEDFTITADGDYDMPDSFGGIDGPLTFAPPNTWGAIPIVGEAAIRERRQFIELVQTPWLAAIAPKSGAATTGQRYVLMLYPTPNTVYSLTFRYLIVPDTLTDSAAYHLGGAPHSEMIRASCLAAAEMHRTQQHGPRWQSFMERLAASIAMDNRMAPEVQAPEGDLTYNRYRESANIPITLNGVVID